MTEREWDFLFLGVSEMKKNNIYIGDEEGEGEGEIEAKLFVILLEKWLSERERSHEGRPESMGVSEWMAV